MYKCRRGEPYKRTDAEVALKIVPKSRIAKPSQRMKIDAEIQIQKSLSHANIVKLLHNFEDNVKICLVLELCERKSLTSLLKLHGQVNYNPINEVFTLYLGTSKRGIGNCSSNYAGPAIHSQQGHRPP